MGLMVLTFIIVAMLSLLGDVFCSLLHSYRSRAFFVRFIFSAWVGTVVFSLLLTNVYRWSHVSEKVFFPYVAGVLGLLVACNLIFRKRLKVRLFRRGIASFLLASFAISAMCVPVLTNWHPSFYFSNNGEFSNYAYVADVVQHHGLNSVVRIADFGTETRETVVALLSAFFGSLFGRSPLFTIIPVSYAISWIAFSTLGLMFELVMKGAGKVPKAFIYLTWAMALLSVGNLQTWLMSFMSQYLCVASFIGLLAFHMHRGGPLRDALFQRLVVPGLAFALILCDYPEMVPPIFGLYSCFLISYLQGTKVRSILTTIAVFMLSIGAGALIGNSLAFANISRMGCGLLNGVGWNIFGPTFPIKYLLQSLFGLGNIFFSPDGAAGVYSLALELLLVLAAAGSLLRTFSKTSRLSKGLSILHVSFIAGAVGTFYLLASSGVTTNYAAVKLTSGFLWIVYLNVGMMIRSKVAPISALACLLILALGYKAAAVSFHCAREFRHDAWKSIVEDEDFEATQRVITSPVYIQDDRRNFRMTAYFLTKAADIYAFYPDTVVKPPYNNERWVFTYGNTPDTLGDLQQIAHFEPALVRKHFTLWSRTDQ